jgi:hypothetical protein
MSEPSGAQRKRLALLGVLLAVVGVFSLVPSPFASAQSGESVDTTLLARPDDPGADRIPVEGAEIRVFDAVIVNREIDSIGDEVGRAVSDATGFVSVPLPGPGSYAVEIVIETLPDGIELVRADKQQLPVEARLGQPTRVLFNLAEGDAAGAARDKTADSRWTRAARLLLQGVIFGLIIGLCAIGLSLIYGTTGLVNFALSEQIVFGALIAYLTKLGKAMRAVSDNPDLAASTGIDVNRIITLVWFTAGFLVTLGGVFQGLSEQVQWLMGFQLLLLVFAGLTLGGLGTDFGAMVGSLVIGVFIFLSSLVVAPELKNVGALIVMILVLMVRPQGIFGRRERIG